MHNLHAVLHKQRSTCLLLLTSFAAWAALRLEPGTLLPPWSWNIITLCVWTAYILTKGLGRLSVWDKRELVWAVLSCAALLQFLAQDPSFRNWGEAHSLVVAWQQQYMCAEQYPRHLDLESWCVCVRVFCSCSRVATCFCSLNRRCSVLQPLTPPLPFLPHPGDVYFFCGSHMEYCTCSYRWNTAGWVKAAVLWNFVLSSALGLQRLLIQLGLKGLLPGEEACLQQLLSSCSCSC